MAEYERELANHSSHHHAEEHHSRREGDETGRERPPPVERHPDAPEKRDEEPHGRPPHDGRDEPQPEFVEQRRVAAHLLEHRIDQHRFARCAVGKQVRVRRRLRVEELPEDHREVAPSPAASRRRRRGVARRRPRPVSRSPSPPVSPWRRGSRRHRRAPAVPPCSGPPLRSTGDRRVSRPRELRRCGVAASSRPVARCTNGMRSTVRCRRGASRNAGRR